MSTGWLVVKSIKKECNNININIQDMTLSDNDAGYLNWSLPSKHKTSISPDTIYLSISLLFYESLSLNNSAEWMSQHQYYYLRLIYLKEWHKVRQKSLDIVTVDMNNIIVTDRFSEAALISRFKACVMSIKNNCHDIPFR